MPHWFKSKWSGKRQSIIFDLLGSGRSFKHWSQLTFTRGPIFGKCLRFFRARIIIIVKFNNPFRPQNGGSFILMVRIYRCSNACNSQELQLLYFKNLTSACACTTGSGAWFSISSTFWAWNQIFNWKCKEWSMNHVPILQNYRPSSTSVLYVRGYFAVHHFNIFLLCIFSVDHYFSVYNFYFISNS